MNTLAVIPARGGSKGIPRKNLARLAGRPLIAHALAACLEAERVDRVVVSTDSPEIGAAAEELGAEVVIRPAEISGDEASSELALLHVLKRLDAAEGYRPDILIFVQCTSPLTLAADIDGAVGRLLETGAECCFTVAPFQRFLWTRDQGGNLAPLGHPFERRPRRQEREAHLVETGAVYVLRTEGFLRARHRFFGRVVGYEVQAQRALEIDEPADLLLAEALLARAGQDAPARQIPRPVAGVVLDFDGVFTDNRALLFEDGSEAVLVSRADGLGLERLRALGVPLLVLSGERAPVVAARCAKLGLACLSGVADKLAALKAWIAENGLDPRRVLYVGNDANDLACLRHVGCAVAVGDALPEARAAARLRLRAPGGNGAIRELADLLCAAEEP